MKKLAKLFLILCVLLTNVQTAIPAQATPAQATMPYGDIISPTSGPLSPDDTGKVTIQATANAGTGAELERVSFFALYDGEWHHLGDDEDNKAPYQIDWYPGCIPPQEILLRVHVENNIGHYVQPIEMAAVVNSHSQQCKLVANNIHLSMLRDSNIAIVDLANPSDRRLKNPSIKFKVEQIKDSGDVHFPFRRLLVKDFVAQDSDIQKKSYVAINGTGFDVPAIFPNIPHDPHDITNPLNYIKTITGMPSDDSRLNIGEETIENADGSDTRPQYFFRFDGGTSYPTIDIHQVDTNWPTTQLGDFLIAYSYGILNVRDNNDPDDSCIHLEKQTDDTNHCLDPDYPDQYQNPLNNNDDYTAIGISGDKTKVFLVRGNSIGLLQLSGELKRLGATKAFLLDSGGSSQMSAQGGQNLDVVGYDWDYAAIPPSRVARKVINGIVAYNDTVQASTPIMVYDRLRGNVGLEINQRNEGKVLTTLMDWGNPTIADGWIPSSQLSDVPPLFFDTGTGNPFFYWIQLLKLAGIIDGYPNGTYRSGEIVYRDAMAKYIANSLDKAAVLRAKGYNSVQACGQNFKNTFPDVNENTKFHDEIWCIAGLGIVSGYSDGKYHPELPVLRDQMAKFIVNASATAGILNKLGYDTVQQCAKHGTEFPDVDENNKFHDEIKCLVALEIVAGYSDGKYHPSEPVTRGPMAKYIANGNNSLLAQAVCYPTYPKTNCEDALVWAQAQKLAPIIDKNNASDLAFARAVTQVFNVANAQASLNTEALSLLQSGVWLASSHGVIYYNPDNNKLITYTVKDKLPHNKVNAIARNPVNGEIWACTNLGVAKFDGSKWTPYTKPKGFAPNLCNDITISPSGIVWVATNKGLSKFDGAWTNYFAPKYTLPRNHIRASALDNRGNLWGVVVNRLGYFDGKSWHMVTKLPNGKVDAVAFVNNILYLGGNHGILKYENGKFDSIKPAFKVDALTSDDNGYLWVISNRSRLGVYHAGEWVVPIP